MTSIGVLTTKNTEEIQAELANFNEASLNSLATLATLSLDQKTAKLALLAADIQKLSIIIGSIDTAKRVLKKND